MRVFLLRFSVVSMLLAASCGGSGSDGEKKDLSAVDKNSGDPEVERQKENVAQVGMDARAHFKRLATKKKESKNAALVASPADQSVILIVIDTLTAGHLSSYGYDRKTTPRIDALADEGLLMRNYVSNSSWTRPSYTTIITGLPKTKHKVELGGVLKMDTTTLAERFRKAGFQTAGFVGNPLVREIWGFGQGYKVYKDTIGYKKAFPWDGKLVDDAIAWFDTVGDEKHFTSLFMTSPHAPYRPPRGRRNFLKTVPKGIINEYPFREYKRPLPKNEHLRIVAAYDDEVAYADYQVGRIVDYLKEKNRLDTTTIAVVADHGEMLGEHNCYGHGYHMWEENLRVPLVIRSANLAVKGQVDDTPHTHVDLAPSLLALAGISTNSAELPGISLFDDSGKELDRIRLSQYDAHDILRQAVRDNRYKIVHYNKIEAAALQKLNSLRDQIPTADPMDLPSLAASLKGERYELYDLHTDPNEAADLFEERKGDRRIHRLLEALLEPMTEKEAPVGQMSDELIEALKNAGYFVSGDE